MNMCFIDGIPLLIYQLLVTLTLDCMLYIGPIEKT